MKIRAIFVLIAMFMSAAAGAGEFAYTRAGAFDFAKPETATSETVFSETAPIPTAKPADDGMDIRGLFGPGTIPKVSHLDDKYKSKSTKRQCRSAWRTLRRREVSRRPAAVPETIIAKAVRAGVSEKHIKKTLAVYLANQDSIPNQKYITVIDFNKRSNQKRLFTIDLSDGSVKSYHVAAGKGSDPNGDGRATHFSNRAGTNASSLGCALAAGEYSGKHGRSIMMHGFESTNDNSCDRAVVFHAAKYAGGVPGRSWGCPAVKPGDRKELFDKITGGGLVCSYKDGEVREVASVKKASKKKPKKKNQGRKKSGRRKK